MGSWLAMRGIWRRVARNWAPRARDLGTRLVAAAQQAIDAARKSTE
jgi:predicted DNA-binding transcriptional regulator AlpA